jgi:hypothetical protein
VQVDVHEGGGEVFHRREALVEVARAHQLVEKGVRDRLTGPAMRRVGAQDVGLRQPMLEQLGRQLDEIGGDTRPGEQRISDVRQEPVQGVAEFVEEGAGVVEAQEGGLGLREIHHVDDDRPDVAGELLL